MNAVKDKSAENPFAESLFIGDVVEQAEITTGPEAAPGEVYAAIAEFESSHELLAAVKEVRQRGYTALDTMTPFPVHGMDQAIGLKHSRLGWLVLALGATGAGCALLLQWWTGAVDYPLNIGGKPLFAIEFAMPVTFELLVLFAAFACVFGMLAWNGLPRLFHPAFNYSQFHRASNDRFLLVIEKEDPLFDSETSADMLRELGGTNVELVEP